MVDQTVIDEARNRIIEIISEENPKFDTRTGTVNSELLINLSAIGLSIISQDISNFELTNTISDIAANESNVDSTVADSILSNFLVSRKQGTNAEGVVKVLVTESRDYFVPSGTVFQSENGLNYVTTSDNDISQSSLISENLSFFFTLPITASEVGSASKAKADTVFTTSIFTAQIISVSALNDFTGGEDEESVSSVLADLKNRLGTRDFQSPRSINAILLDEDNFPSITQLTILGFKDRELQRSLGPLGVKNSNAFDILYRTKDVETKVLEITSDSNGLVSIPSENLPVLRVKNYARRVNAQATLDVEEINIGSSNSELSPEFARFSIFERISFQSEFDSTDLLVEVDVLNLTNDIQEFVDSEETRNVTADVLVRTFMPAFVSVTANYKSNANLNQDDIASQIVEFINTYQEEKLFISSIVNVILNFDGVVAVDLPINVVASYHFPDGTIVERTGDSEISISENIALGASDKTFSFFSTLSDIVLVESII